MTCCNERRSAAARHGILRAATIAQSQPAVSVPGSETVPLLYTGPNGVTFRGPVSGAVYPPGRKGQDIYVDQRDVATFLRTNMFEMRTTVAAR